MSLHVDDLGGAGSPLLFIHGWGMHGGMWGEAPAMLAENRRVLSVDLPGHGYSRNATGGGLDEIVELLTKTFSEPLDVCGWSLGGQIALRWAELCPSRVKKLILVSSTPCFVQKAGWHGAMAPDTLAAFAAALQNDYAATLRRFLALQVRGAEDERGQLLQLRQSLQSRGEPDIESLRSSLGILRDTDLRAALPELPQPTLVVAGARDTLTPLAASEYIASLMLHASLVRIGGAAHAPFLSHRGEFVKHLADFLHE